MALIERIITVYNDKGSKQAIKDVNKLEKSFAEAGKKIAKAFLVAGAATAALAVKIGKDAVQAAIADQKSQVLLANALRNTVGATDESIFAAEEYISAMQSQFSIADDELRPSLAALAAVTRDLAQAQAIQNVAIDVAAGTGKDLSAVTNAMVKAYQGNIGALRRLNVPLDDSIIKSKDFQGAMVALSKTFAGAGATSADTFEGRMRGLSLTYEDIIEQLGYALIPVLSDFANLIKTEVLPVLQTFIENNKEGIAQGLRDSIDAVVGITKALAKMFKLVADNTGALKVFAGIIVGTFVGTKIAAGIQLIAAGIAGLITLFKRQAVAAGAAGTATALATGGATAVSAAAGLVAFGAAAAGTIYLINEFTDSVTTSTAAVKDYNGVVVGHLADLKNLEKATAAANLKNVISLRTITNTVKKTKEQIQLEQVLAKLKKAGITPTSEKDPITLEAARLNLIRQGRIAEAERVKEMMANLETQMKMNNAAQKYADLLQVLADSKISDQEVAVLAQKWNMTKGEVLEYIARIYAANTTEIDEGPVIKLLMAWGLTKEQAQKYVDFTRALADEKIDDKEIEKLMGKWGMTRAEVLAYAKQVQTGTTFSTTWDDPGKAAQNSWLNALSALNAYIAALTTMTPQVPASVTPTTPSVAPTPINPFGSDEQTRLSEIRRLENLYGPTTGITSGSTFDPGSFRMRDNAGMTVNVTVQGNVQTEADLADAIRQRILLEQQSGKPILFVGGL
jgi:copper chaperone CopZ